MREPGASTLLFAVRRSLFGLALGELAFVFQDLDFITVGIGDEGHLGAARCKFLFPIAWPNLLAVIFQHLAVFDDVVYSQAGVYKVLGEFYCVVGRVGKLQSVGVSGQLEVDDLIASRALVVAFEDCEAAILAVPIDRLFQVANSNACMKKFDHLSELNDALRYAKRG